MKKEIARQSRNASIDTQGDIGYFDKAQKWVFNSKDDLSEILRTIQGGKPCTLWVQGLEKSKMKKRSFLRNKSDGEITVLSDSDTDIDEQPTKNK